MIGMLKPVRLVCFTMKMPDAAYTRDESMDVPEDCVVLKVHILSTALFPTQNILFPLRCLLAKGMLCYGEG